MRRTTQKSAREDEGVRKDRKREREEEKIREEEKRRGGGDVNGIKRGDTHVRGDEGSDQS